ncbi:MAG: NADH-quinone oxidoreductase subunit J [Verrucomicrobiota bacterium]
MEALIFWIVAVGVTVSAIAVVANRNPVASALCLATSFIFLAIAFLSLQAFFLAMVQVIVYAGAVMVLFLFIIMLLDLKAEEKRSISWGKLALLIVLLVVPLAVFQQIAGEVNEETEVLSWSENQSSLGVKELGEALFQEYLLPFEATAVLLLIATIGVVILSQRQATPKNHAKGSETS